MRTPEQINNWRRVLLNILGPYTLFMSDAEVNRFADLMQDKVDEGYVSSWKWKVKFLEDAEKSWDDIPLESKKVEASLKKMKDFTRGFIERHPKVHSVLLIDQHTKSETYLFERGYRETTLGVRKGSD